MANARLKYGALYDVIDSSVSEEKESIFHTYIAKEDTGKRIFKELYTRFQADSSKGHVGFYMDDGKQIGILSQCQSMQALMLLASEFGLDFDDEHIIDAEKSNLTIRQIMDMVIEDIIERITEGTEENQYRFDASPYEKKLFTVQYSNVDTITWVVTSFLLALKYHATIGETCKWEKQLVDVISYGLRYFNDSFIESEAEGTSNSLNIGWNFTKDCQEPSLYYSFTVCECFVDFFTTFEEYLSYKEADRDFKMYGLPVDKNLAANFKKHQQTFEKLTKEGDRGYDKKTGKKLAQYDEYNELKMRYCEINNGLDSIENTFYGELEAKCKRVAKEIWRLAKGELADAFFYNDLHTTISEDEIGMATTSDALFNTVYIINILLDSGLDEDFKKDIEIARSAGDNEAAADAEREYNNLFESCQMAVQKAFRTYEKLQNNGKEYIVDQFLVGFNENFTVHRNLIKDLRKRRMRVFSLMPLLIHTNNVISEYLIQYPQINMRKYLGYILENRFEENNKSKWIWEKDGYFSCSNYYYISALGEFYAYYEKYESKFIDNYVRNEEYEAKIIKQTEEMLLSSSGKLGELEREIQRRDLEIKHLNELIQNVSKPIEDAVIEVTTEKIKQLFPEMLCDFLRNAASGLTVSAIDNTELQDEHTEFADALGDLLVAVISKQIYDAIRPATLSKDEQNIKYRQLEKHIRDDFSELLFNYVYAVKNSPIHSSQLFESNKGE
ncbi:MAG: hypothetical protein IKB86_00475 [Clostridia bacterium]|nr:hypothetical protein [Clostridia bacterium]